MNYNKYIDHTNLKQNMTTKDLEILCKEAAENNFASVCVNPSWITKAAELLKGTDVMVCTVIGFPLGASTTEVKVFETIDAISNGADEIDMVINISALIDGRYDYVENEIKKIVEAANGKTVKVIIETCLLTEAQKRKACQLILSAGAHFVKTSTGFSTSGATFEDVIIFKEEVEEKCLIKAAGGVRTLEDLKKMIELGANRIGTSGGVTIIKGVNNDEQY